MTPNGTTSRKTAGQHCQREIWPGQMGSTHRLGTGQMSSTTSYSLPGLCRRQNKERGGERVPLERVLDGINEEKLVTRIEPCSGTSGRAWI